MAKDVTGEGALGGIPVALGGNVFGWTAGEAASFAILDAFVDGGGMLPGDGGKGLSPARIAAACDASLARLQIDRIDLYHAHQDDTDVPQADVTEAFAGLVAAGKVGTLGASKSITKRSLGDPDRIRV